MFESRAGNPIVEHEVAVGDLIGVTEANTNPGDSTLFEKDDIKKLETGVKVFIEKDEWQLLP